MALGTEKGRQLSKKAVGKTIRKGAELGGKAVKATAKAAGSAAKETAKEVGKATKEAAKEVAQETREAAATKAAEVKQSVAQTVRNRSAADKAKLQDLSRRAKEKAQKDIETTKNVFRRRKKTSTKKPIGQLSPATEPKVGRLPKRKKGFIKNLADKARERARKDVERRKRILGFKLERVNSIDFAKKKSVKVRSYRRKDGTVVRGSTRQITQKERTVGEKIGDVGRGLLPVAAALATGANAVSAISDAQLRRRQVGRELGALGETRKFLGLAGSAGSGFRSASLGVDTLTSLAGKGKRIRLQERGQELRERKFEDTLRRTGLWEYDLSQRDKKRSFLEDELKVKSQAVKLRQKALKKKKKKKKKGTSE